MVFKYLLHWLWLHTMCHGICITCKYKNACWNKQDIAASKYKFVWNIKKPP